MTDPSDPSRVPEPGPGAGPSAPDPRAGSGADPRSGSGAEPAAAAGAGTAELSYEAARTELATVVERLEAGGCTLEEALALWERGEALARVCQHRLDGAQARLDAATPQASTPQAESGGPAAGR